MNKNLILFLLTICLSNWITYLIINSYYSNKIEELHILTTTLSEENAMIAKELAKTKEVEQQLKSRGQYLSSAINKYAKRSSAIDKDKVIQDLLEVKKDLETQAERLDSIQINYPNRTDDALINSLKYKLSL